MIIKLRTRQHWTGKVILQVLDRVKDGPPDWNGMPEYLAGDYWRDAVDTDIIEISKLLNNK